MKNSDSVRWLLKKSRCQRKNMILLILSNIVFSVLSVIFAFCVRGIIDGGVDGNGYKIVVYSVAICLVVLFQFLFRIIINGMTEHIKGKLEMQYKSFVFGEILNKKYSEINKYHSGELLNRLTSDCQVTSKGMSTILPTIVSSMARLICGVIALVIIDWVFAVAFLIAGILVSVVITVYRKKLKNLHKSALETEGKVRSFMQECIENKLVVKVFNVKDKINEKADNLQNDNFKVKMKRKNYSVTGHATYNIIYSIGYLFALIYGAFKIYNKYLSFGDLSAILQLVNNVQVPFASLSNLVPEYYAMIASAERLMEIEKVDNEYHLEYVDKDKTYSNLDYIEFKNVSFDFNGECVFDNLSGKINKGEFVALDGFSGQGKSTLMHLMLGIYPLKEGGIYLVKKDGSKIPLSANTRSLFSYVPQGNMLFSGTIKENVAFMNSKVDCEKIVNALKISDMLEFVNELPLGIETVVGEQGMGLSEGQIQRVAIARAVLYDSPIMIFDEATSALDKDSERKIYENLKQLKNKTIIVISHKREVLPFCDRSFTINNKKMIENHKEKVD